MENVEALVAVMEAEKLSPLFNIPAEMRNRQVEVTVRPIESAGDTVAERIKTFRAKYTREGFVEQLKQKSAEGFQFDFDVQKVIDGTETEEERAARYRAHKRTQAEL